METVQLDRDQFNALVQAIEARLTGGQHFVYLIMEGDPANTVDTLYGRPIPRQGDDYYLDGEKFIVKKVAWAHRRYQFGPKEGQIQTYGAEITLGKGL